MLKPLFFTLMFLFVANCCFAQDTSKRTIPIQPDTAKKATPLHQEPSYLVVRAVTGVEKSFYTELGLGWHHSVPSIFGAYNEVGPYAAIEWVPAILPIKDKNIYAIKTGLEFNGIVSWGLEVKYQTDGINTDASITPKVGIGPTQFIYLYFGWNLSSSSSPFKNISGAQFSILFDIHGKKFKKIYKIPESIPFS